MAKTIPQTVAGYIVCGSHRTRDKVFRIIGNSRQGYNLAFTGHDMNHKGIYPVADAAEMARCLSITGARALSAKKIPHLSACWSFES